jgi:hypothetical protein
MILSIFKNKKAGVIGFFFFALLFLVFWIFVLSTFLSTSGDLASVGKTGFELFFYSNLNFFVFIGFVLFLIMGVLSQ